MALTRLDNLYSSKTGRYLYVSPDDFNATDELDNRGNSPLRPFKTIQRAFIEVARYSYLPGKNNDRFDQFSIMLMPGNHYIDNRPGLVNLDVPLFNFNQVLGEWDDNSILDLSNPDNVLYKFNAASGGAIVPRGCSLVGYDLRRTIIRPLYVPDPVDGNQERTSIFNLTGGCYLWQFTIKDGDLSSNSPLYDESANVGKVYYQKGNVEELVVPEYSHHKICIMTYADNKDLDLYYQKVARAFSKFQPTIDDGDLEALVQENRIVGPLSDTRSIESIQPIDSPGKITFKVTTKIDHGYFEGQYVAVLNSGLADDVNGTFKITRIDQNNTKVFEYEIFDKVSAAFNLISNQIYTSANGLSTNAVAQAEIDSVESASPYVFNCSIRSTWGLCGMWADGSKATGFKSMVVAQYTGVSLQKDDRAFIRYDKFTNTWNQASLRDAFATVPYHTKGDAYWKDDWRNFHIRASDDAFVQCVSVFAVGFFDHFLMESGGDMSITNSNSNFGNTSLHATGFKGFSFNQDKGGYITDIIPPKAITGGYSDDPAKDSFNSKKISYYPFDIKASNDSTNHTKLYIGSDTARNPNEKPATTLNGYRIGARSGERVFVKLEPLTSGGTNKYYSTLSPTGFQRFTVSLETLNPSGITIDNYAQDAANSIEANRLFIQEEAYGYIIQKYSYLLTKPDIDITKCKRDIGYFVDAVVSDLKLGGNVNTIQAAEAYYIGNQLAYIVGEKSETIETLDYVKNLCIIAMRNFDILIKDCGTTAGSALVNVGSTAGLVVGMSVAEYDPGNFTNGKLNFGSLPVVSNVRNNSFIKRIVNETTIELGTPGSKLTQGDLRPTLQNSNSAYLYFTLPQGAWSTTTPSTNNSLIQDTEYPECADVASTIEGYFTNVKTIINVGVVDNGVVKIESDLETANLAPRATLFTVSGSNPHNLETGTPVRLVPKAKAGTNPDKRVIRLPKEFDTNTRYYVIAPGRATYPENYANSSLFGGVFDGTDQTKFMLARSKENACAGIYIYSPETDSVDPDVEIELQQYLLDESYSLHKYKCNLVGSGVIETDVTHVFDLPANGVSPQSVFFREAEDIIGSELPQIAGQGTISSNTYFYPRYVSAKRITIHRSYADAVAGVNAINFSPNTGSNFYIFANKRVSPVKFDAAFVDPSTNNTTGLWYLSVLDESSPGNERLDSILNRFHQADYADDSGKIRSNDTWYERVEDDRSKEDRTYRLRYVIPNYLETVRDPLNGFVLKVRTDDKRRLRPQKAVLKPIGGAVNVARFFNPAQQAEQLGLRETEYGSISALYDPYLAPKIVTSQRTQSKIGFSIQSAKKITQSGTDYLEIVAFDHTITNEALKNEQFTVLTINAPQSGSFTLNSQITWTGNSSGIATLHGYFNVGSAHYIIIRAIQSGSVEYNSVINTRFTQGATFADLIAKPNSVGDSRGRSKSSREDFLYRVDGANVYTLVPGDVITDDTDNQYYIESVTDVEDIEDSFYIFDVDEIQERIPNQQDGIYYLTCVRGNISPFPTGAGVGNNFKNFKFSQPISQLYPQNYKNDPFWYRQIDPTANDAPASISAADNFIHGLVTINDAKFSETKEAIIDLIENPVLDNYVYTNTTQSVDGDVQDNRIRAQEGNASAGSEDRKIKIAGDSKFPLEQKLYVELRRPSIARSGNHTFEYLGFGPGNYSTGFPLRQEVLLSDKQDFYAQAKRENGGIVFYTGLNSNGDLYIGNRKINAITGEETFLEQASLIDSGDEDDNIGTSLVTTFDTPVTFNDRITVLGNASFTNPVEINVEAQEGIPLTVYSKVRSDQDVTLSRSSYRPNSKGDITIGNNRVNAAIFGVTPRSLVGLDGQAYSIRTHFAVGAPSNITPNNSQKLFANDFSSNRFSDIQIVQFANEPARSGDILLKGESVGNSGSLGWIYANSYRNISQNISQIIAQGTSRVKVVLNPTVTNEEVGVTSDSQLRITQFSNFLFNGIWSVESQGFIATSNEFYIIVPDISTSQIFNWEDQGNVAKVEVGTSNWKEFGVIGSEVIRTTTNILGQYKLGINTVARSAHTALNNGYVSTETDPRANLDVVGTAFISGKTIENYRGENTTVKTETSQNNAFLVGGNSSTPNDKATLRISTTNNGRIGINTTNDQLNGTADSSIYNVELAVIGSTAISDNLRVGGTSTLIGNVTLSSDLGVNGGDITTTVSNGTFNLLNDTTFTGTLNVSNSATQFNLATNAASNIINIGNPLIGASGISRTTIGGAYGNNETNSFLEVKTTSAKFWGDLQIGISRTTNEAVSVNTSAGTINFFSNSGSASRLNFATNASEINIAGQGGFTTVRNSLIVDATLRVKGNSIIDGGVASFSFNGSRAQLGSTISTHTGTISIPTDKNIDFVSIVSGFDNIVDTAAAGPWGGSFFQQAIPAYNSDSGQPLGALTGNKYYLPLKNVPNYDEGDDLLIDSTVSAGVHPEIVKIATAGLVRVQTAPYYVIVERQPYGTFLPIKANHPDTTPIKKLNIALNSTWLTSNIDGTGTVDQFDLAEFGGILNQNDYLFVSRNDTGTSGEVVKIGSSTGAVAQSFIINNGAGVNKFVVDSTNGATTISDSTSFGGLTVFGPITIRGGCSNALTKTFTLTDDSVSPVTRFSVDMCTGNTIIGGSSSGGSLTIGDDFTIKSGITGSTFFSVDAQTGNTVIGNGNSGTLKVEGTTGSTSISTGTLVVDGGAGIAENLFVGGDLNIAGGDLLVTSSGTTRFKVNNTGTVDLGGISEYFTSTGGRKWLYVSASSEQTLTSNINYFVNPTSNLVLKLPANPQSGDMIRILDIGGNITYNVKVIVRCPSGVRLQGDDTNTSATLPGVNLTGYQGGELIVTTPNAAFGLVFAGNTNPDGSSSGVPSNKQGWWLMEI